MWNRILTSCLTLLLLLTGTAFGFAQKEKNYPKYQTEKQQTSPQLKTNGNIPSKVFEILKYIQQNGKPKEGYVGGRRFGNYEKILPKYDANGKAIEYQEWDVNPKIEGQNRGKERLVTGSDGNAYYTNDHYQSFTLVPRQPKK